MFEGNCAKRLKQACFWATVTAAKVRLTKTQTSGRLQMVDTKLGPTTVDTNAVFERYTVGVLSFKLFKASPF